MALRRRSLGNSSNRNRPFVLPMKKNLTCRKEADSSYEQSTIRRLPILSFLKKNATDLHESECTTHAVFRGFKSPCTSLRSDESDRLLRVKTLGSRRRSSGGFIPPMIKHDLPPAEVIMDDVEDALPPVVNEIEKSPADVVTKKAEPLILWQCDQDESKKVIVPEILGQWLRPHQREGVSFMFECVAGLRDENVNGCILADDMGLGKTLQSIALLYTLLQTGMEMKPTIKKSIVVCPTSLVKNWDDEINKWLKGRVQTIALSEANRAKVISGISKFTGVNSAAQVLIISYETYRMHSARLTKNPNFCELLICDEAHRLKNSMSKINQALNALPCRRRVLLSGTPMQNDLEEFYAMVDFTNPNILGDTREFRRNYMSPILVGREPDSTDKEREKAQGCSSELCEIVNVFILRRTNVLNAQHLPPKLTQIVCCQLTQLQRSLYQAFLDSCSFIEGNSGKKSHSSSSAAPQVLSSITALKKLCNHPNLIMSSGNSSTVKTGFEHIDINQFLMQTTNYNMNNALHRRGGQSKSSNPEWSGKMLVLDRMMQIMRRRTSDRIVIVSNYTQTLDVVSSLCRERGWPVVRLDGSTSSQKRKKLVDSFNDLMSNSFAFLLSSKAGGCGLNLIGGNRLVLFDPDWNPATDKQAAARIWREGQQKKCYIYRFISTGTLEEKIFQRQLSKEGLQSIVDDKAEVNSLASKDLKKLFILRNDTLSDTHDQLKCSRCKWRVKEKTKTDEEISRCSQDVDEEEKENCVPESEMLEEITPGSNENGESKTEEFDAAIIESDRLQPQVGMPAEEDLNNWSHHCSYETVDDEIMKEAQAGSSLVSFVFGCRIDWNLLQEYSLKEPDNDKKPKPKMPKKLLNKRLKAKNSKNEVTGSSSEFNSDSSEEENSDIEPVGKQPNHKSIITIDSSDDDIDHEGVAPKEPKDKCHVEEVVIESTIPLNNDGISDEVIEAPAQQTNHVTPLKKARKVSFSSTTNNGPGLIDEEIIQEFLDSDSDSDFDFMTKSDEKEKSKMNEQVVEDGMWQCSRCTLLNPDGLAECNSCGLKLRSAKRTRY